MCKSPEFIFCTIKMNNSLKSFSIEEARKLLREKNDTYYSLADQNHILYLSGGGWSSLEGLSLFINLRALYIEDNSMNIAKIPKPLLMISQAWLTYQIVANCAECMFHSNQGNYG
jgi:hypothetical protein